MQEAKYKKMPKANFELLKEYAKPSSLSGSANRTYGVVMLKNPPIGNQGSQGSCVGWALGYSAMGILTYPKTVCWETARRSPSYVYNQIKIDASCSSGATMVSGLNLLKNKGVCSYNSMPYGTTCSTLPTFSQNVEASQSKAINWTTLNRNDVWGVKSAIDLGFPVVVGFDVTTAFDEMWGSWSTPGIWTSNSGPSRGGHAACIVGYDENKQMFKVQNQWGTTGDGGFFWVTYDLVRNNCFREMYIVYGVTPALTPEINGPDCISSEMGNTSSPFKIDNLQAGGISVTWSAMPASAVIINTPNAVQTTVTKLNGGAFTLTATVRNTCNTAAPLIITKEVNFPLPPPTNITATQNSLGYYVINCNPPQYYEMQYVDLITNQTGSDWIIIGDPNDYFYYSKNFKFRLKNFSCGLWSDWLTVTPPPCPEVTFPSNPTYYRVYTGVQGYNAGYGGFTWNAVIGATKYKVEYMAINLTNSAVLPITGTFFSISTNSPMQPTPYLSSDSQAGTWIIKLRVQSQCSNGSWSEFSPWSANFAW